MRQTIKNQILASLSLLAILLAIVIMLVVIISLENSAEDADAGEHLSHLITENCLSLNALEWQAIANERIDPLMIESIEEHRTEIDESIAALTTLYPDEKRLSTMQSDFDKYKEATDEEFELIAAGRITDALAIDEEEVDPIFDRLLDMAEATSGTTHAKATSSGKTSYYLIIVTSLLTVFITVVVLMLYTNARQKNRQIRTEKTALALSEERFRSVAQTANEAIITINEKQIVTYWNASATRILGYALADALGQHIEFIIPKKFWDQFSSAMKSLSSSENVDIIKKPLEATLLKNDGNEIPVEISASRWQIQDGAVFITAIMHDISDRKLTEKLMADQRKALEQRAVQLSTLFEVGKTISGTIELQRLLDDALASILNSEVLQVQQKAGILLEKDGRLTLVSHIGHSEEFVSIHQDIGSGECLCGLAMKTGSILISEDSSCDVRHSIRYPGMEPHGHVIVPLKAMDEVVGVLYLYTNPGTVIDEERKQLFATIGGQLGIAIENARLFEKTKKLSLHDPLTGLANRYFMNIELRKTAAMARRTGRPLSLIMLDLDHFKKYNDTYGHPAGDKMLADIAAIIVSIMRETDMAVRYGGEEFLIILPDTDNSSAALIAERIRTTIEHTGFLYSGNVQPNQMTVSLGVATFDQKSNLDEETRLIVMADEALYHAKNKGRNQVALFGA